MLKRAGETRRLPKPTAGQGYMLLVSALDKSSQILISPPTARDRDATGGLARLGGVTRERDERRDEMRVLLTDG